MSERAETIRKRFFRRLHRAVFQSVPNDAPSEVDLSKLRRDLEPEEGVEFSFEWGPDESSQVHPIRTSNNAKDRPSGS
jgi:hypothetical protein